jgi:hypothetical protein
MQSSSKFQHDSLQTLKEQFLLSNGKQNKTKQTSEQLKQSGTLERTSGQIAILGPKQYYREYHTFTHFKLIVKGVCVCVSPSSPLAPELKLKALVNCVM